MCFRPLSKRVHISQRCHRKIRPTASRTAPISRTTVDSSPLAVSAKTLCCLSGCDTKRSFHRNPLCAKNNRTKNSLISSSTIYSIFAWFVPWKSVKQFFTDIKQYFFTLGYIMSSSEFVPSTCASFKHFGHTTSTQSMLRTIFGLCT